MCRAALVLAVIVCEAAAAEEHPSDVAPPSHWSGQASAEAGMFLPFTVSPRTGVQKAVVSVVSGYDLTRGAVMRAGTEINPWGPIVLQAGTLYDGATGWQPRLGLRVQILRQARHAIDIAIGAQYDGASYENKPGFETFIALSRQFGRLGLFANLVYGQELEPSQRHGDVRLAALGRVAGSFYLGLDSRAAFDLDSGREQLEDDERDVDFVLSAGPTASWSVKLFSLLLQGGASATRYKGSSVQAGGFALVGFGVTLF